MALRLGIVLSLCTLVLRAIPAFADSCDRIVSLAPSITETAYSIGLGQNIVGVTKFDRFPIEVIKKTKVGGFIDPNLEVVVSLKPKLVLYLPESEAVAKALRPLGIESLELRQNSYAEILLSIETLGRRCDRSAEAQDLIQRLRDRIDVVVNRSRGLPRQRVCIVVGAEGGDLGTLFISGSDGFYSSLLEVLNAKNVYERKTAALPNISVEGLVSLNPDVIFHIVYSENEGNFNEAVIKSAWSKLNQLRAVRDGRVHILSKDFTHIPGPRFVDLLEEMSTKLRGES